MDQVKLSEELSELLQVIHLVSGKSWASIQAFYLSVDCFFFYFFDTSMFFALFFATVPVSHLSVLGPPTEIIIHFVSAHEDAFFISPVFQMKVVQAS